MPVWPGLEKVSQALAPRISCLLLMPFLWSPGRSGGRKNTAENSRKDFRGNDTHLLVEAIPELHCSGCVGSVLLRHLHSNRLLAGTYEEGQYSTRVGSVGPLVGRYARCVLSPGGRCIIVSMGRCGCKLA